MRPPVARRPRFPLGRAVLIALGVVTLAAIALAPGSTPTREAPRAFRLATDAGGPVEEWILTLGDDLHDLFLPTVLDLIEQADRRTRFRILHGSPGGRRKLEAGLRKREIPLSGRIRWERVEGELPYWCRDLFLTGERADGSPAFLTFHPDHYPGITRAAEGEGGQTLAAVRSLAGPAEVPSLLRLEGGGIVSDERRAFVSPSTVLRAAGSLSPEARAEFRARLERDLGLPVEILRTTPGIPAPHCDLYLTPAGDGTVVLGDFALGERLLREAGEREQAEFAAELERLGGLLDRDAPVRILDGAPLTSLLPRGPRRAEICRSLDAVAGQLAGLGYRVARVPWVGLDVASMGRRRHLSYNNVILETRDGVRTVYLPRFGLAGLDRCAAERWREAGFRVKRVGALGPALMAGGVRCLSQVVRAPSAGGTRARRP